MSMTKTQRIVNEMKKSSGRFFGLTTINGEQINSQFIKETPSYVTVHDRNKFKDRKIRKESLAGFRLGSTVI